MVAKLLIAWLLMALCVALHAAGLTEAIRWVKRRTTRLDARFWFATWMLIRVAGWTILLHLVQIGIWACFYAWKLAMPDLASAFYFSAVTYTTTGYGDLVLPPPWRLVGAVEALTGILMCGLSTGFFFAVLSKVFGARTGTESSSNYELPADGKRSQ
jgi:hypothetical protein